MIKWRYCQHFKEINASGLTQNVSFYITALLSNEAHAILYKFYESNR